MKMRQHIRNELENSGLIGKISEFRLYVLLGSSGTIKAIEKAVCKRYSRKVDENVGMLDEFVRREWRFTRHELSCLVDSVYDDEKEMGGRVKRMEFFKRRATFILAGTVLLDEIFERLGIEAIEVSVYALGEGVITEILGQVLRWRSVFRLASRFYNKKGMKAAMICSDIVREIFEGLRKLNEACSDNKHDNELSVSLDDRDLECLNAACLLHNITGKKGYHKQSYRFIMNGDHLHCNTKEEIKICHLNFQFMEFIDSPEGFKLVLCEGEARNQSTVTVQPLADTIQQLAGDINVSLEK